MTSPQKENGYTPIANELVEQLYKLPLNGTQFRIVLVVFRYTYGFNRKEHELSETFIASALSTHKRQIQRELKALISMQILDVTKQATFNSSRVVKFNKHYDRWLISQQVTKTTPDDKNVPHTGDVLDTSRGGELVTQEIQTKDNIKESIVQSNKKFKQPTIEEVIAYCTERGKKVNPHKWYDHYTANGWMVGKTKMKDWKAAVRTWEPDEKTKEQSKYPDQSNYFKGVKNVPT